VSVILANIQVTKTVVLFGLEATLGNIVYATSFLATDILSECYGKKDAARAVGIGFFSLVVMTVLMNMAIIFIPAESDFVQESMTTIFALMPRIALGSLIAYVISQVHDIHAFDYWKRKLPGSRWLWLRNNASTMVSQLIDTLLFTMIAFYGYSPERVVADSCSHLVSSGWLPPRYSIMYWQALHGNSMTENCSGTAAASFAPLRGPNRRCLRTVALAQLLIRDENGERRRSDHQVRDSSRACAPAISPRSRDAHEPGCGVHHG
jgi:uncharacterized integral membrane protein (TIGR00697 family)